MGNIFTNLLSIPIFFIFTHFSGDIDSYSVIGMLILSYLLALILVSGYTKILLLSGVKQIFAEGALLGKLREDKDLTPSDFEILEFYKSAEMLSKFNILINQNMDKQLVAHDIKGEAGNIQVIMNRLSDSFSGGATHSESFASDLKSITKNVNAIIRLANIIRDKWSNEGRSIIDTKEYFDGFKSCSSREFPEINFEVNSPDNLYIKLDEGSLDRVLSNLKQNSAVKLGKCKNIVIDCSINGDTLNIDFKDDGNLIPAAFVSQLFQKGATTKKSGSGLGLAFCKSVLNANDGDIIHVPDKTYVIFRISLPYVPKCYEVDKIPVRPSTSIIVFDDDVRIYDNIRAKTDIKINITHITNKKDFLHYYQNHMHLENILYLVDNMIEGEEVGSSLIKRLRIQKKSILISSEVPALMCEMSGIRYIHKQNLHDLSISLIKNFPSDRFKVLYFGNNTEKFKQIQNNNRQHITHIKVPGVDDLNYSENSVFLLGEFESDAALLSYQIKLAQFLQLAGFRHIYSVSKHCRTSRFISGHYDAENSNDIKKISKKIDRIRAQTCQTLEYGQEIKLSAQTPQPSFWI